MPARWYADVTNDSDAAFEARARRFVEAVIRGDRAGAAGAVSYPLRVNARHTRSIRNRAALLAAWNSIFTSAVLANLRDAMPHEMFVRNGQAMVANGTVWFDGKGASVVNPPR